MIPDSFFIYPESPSHPQVSSLLSALDAYLASLYAPENNYILDTQALMTPEVDFLTIVKRVRLGKDDGISAASFGNFYVGCGASRRMPAEAATHHVPYCEIKRMYVHPEWRGLRLAERLLLLCLEARMLGGGVKLATLETGADQKEAIRLYERSGYVRRGPFAGYPDNGFSVFFEKWLVSA